MVLGRRRWLGSLEIFRGDGMICNPAMWINIEYITEGISVPITAATDGGQP